MKCRLDFPRFVGVDHHAYNILYRLFSFGLRLVNQKRFFFDDEGNWKRDFSLFPILTRDFRLAIAVVVELRIICYSLYSIILTKYFSLFGLSVSR